MARLAEFVLPDGSSIVAEVDDDSYHPPILPPSAPAPAPAGETPGRVMRGGFTPAPAAASAVATELVVKANDTFDSALDRIRSAADSMLNRLTSLAQPPDELTVEFGVKLNAETGAVIAKASTEANFTIHLKWSRARGSQQANGAKPPGEKE